MLGVVVASLTITNPYVFKILNNFLIWAIATWERANTLEPPSGEPGVTTSLLRPPSGNAQNPSPGEDKHPNSPVAESGPSSGDDNVQANEDCTPNAAVSNDLRPPSENGQISSPGEDEHPNSPDAESGSSSGDQNVQVSEARTPDAAVSNEQNVRVPGLQNGSTANPAPGVTRQTQYGTETISDVLAISRDSREGAWNLIRNSLDGLKKQTRSPDILVIVIVTIFFGVFVGYVVASTFSAKIASDRAGLASSQYCGIWQFDDKAGKEAADRDDLYNYQKEARASQYARTCYNTPNPNDPFSCRIFYNQSIEFDTKTDQPCPFASSELCSGGLYSAVLFDTGLIDASVIGVNAPVTHKFRRTTSCSPLNMSKPYIVSSEGTNNTDYQYYYGSKDDIEYTFNTSGRPFEWLVPVYSVK